MDAAALLSDAGAMEQLRGKQRVELLKAIEALTRDTFEQHPAYAPHRAALGPGNEPKVLAAALDQIWVGIDEYTPAFYQVLEAAVARQALQRACVRQALAQLPHGFQPLDALLLRHASVVGDLYEPWYRAFAQTVQGNETARRLAEDDAKGSVPPELKAHHTVISYSAGGGYTQAANAVHFQREVGAIVAALGDWIADLERCETGQTAAKQQHLAFLAAYRAALAETDIDRLEAAWTAVDEAWMQIRHWIQIVHDHEYGYGDPLRCKVTPEFSVRLLDEAYAAENATIQRIQDEMVAYFSKRPGQLARNGISGLKKSMAGIYYLPFQQGVNLFFRFSGQSIPNRSGVRLSHGCKIYFDPVSTAAREGQARAVARQVCADAAAADAIDTIGTIVYHVAAHEIGHAIYSLDALKDRIRVATRTLLEEPRAELTALHTLLLLQRAGLIDEALRDRTLASFMLQDLRRFVMHDSSATRPYLISAQSNWARAERLGYLTLDASQQVAFDASKVPAFLAECSAQFEAILDAEDAGDGAAIEAVLADMEACDSAPIVRHLVSELFERPRAARAAA